MSMRLLRLPSADRPFWATMKTVRLGAVAILLLASQFSAQGNAQALPSASPADVDGDHSTLPDAKGQGAPSDLVEESLIGDAHLENPKDVFTKVDFPSDAKGHPVQQTIRLNEKVIVKEGERYSGFWFVVDRGEFARKQGIGKGKEKLSFYWYFLPPKPMKHWVVVPVVGVWNAGGSFSPLKLDGFTRLRDAPPLGKDRLILQQLAGSQLKEGNEYYLQFGFPLADTRPVEMTFCAGYRATIGNYKTWDGHNKALHFLGLEHRVSSADRFR